MSKYTPGPWEVHNQTDVFTANGAMNAAGVRCDDNDGWLVADCAVSITMVDGEEETLETKEQIANARLIAAAPELLDAIEHLIPLMPSDADGYDRAIWENAKAIIAKATGKEDA